MKKFVHRFLDLRVWAHVLQTHVVLQVGFRHLYLLQYLRAVFERTINLASKFRCWLSDYVLTAVVKPRVLGKVLQLLPLLNNFNLVSQVDICAKLKRVVGIQILGVKIDNAQLFQIFHPVLDVLDREVLGVLGVVHELYGGILLLWHLLKVVDCKALLEHGLHILVLTFLVFGQIAFFQSLHVVNAVLLVVRGRPLLQDR